MKKIVALVDAIHFKEEQLDAFQYVTRLLKGKLTIVFLEDETGPVLMAPDFADGVPTRYYEVVLAASREKERVISENTTLLQKACRERDIWCNFRKEKGLPADDAIMESRFADLLLVSKDTSFAMLYDSDPPGFLKNVLADAECPVLVLPEGMMNSRETVFAYNGTFSSIYAIKQFTQLFPAMTERKATVLYVTEGQVRGLPHERELKEYLNMHYDNIEYTVLKGEPDKAILSFLGKRKDCIVTFGAYGRSRFSRFFRRSDADNILRKLEIPVFITHP